MNRQSLRILAHAEKRPEPRIHWSTYTVKLVTLRIRISLTGQDGLRFMF